MKNSIYVLFLLLLFSCRKIGMKNQLLDFDGKWNLVEQHIEILHTNGEVSMDTTLYDCGFFNFSKFTRKEKKNYEKADYTEGETKGMVECEYYYVTTDNSTLQIGSNVDHTIIKSTRMVIWSVEHIPLLKPKFYMGRSEWQVIEHDNKKMELVFEEPGGTVDVYSNTYTFKLERP